MASMLDPRLHLRRDVDRAVIYSKFPDGLDGEEVVYFLHPLDAMLLASFDARRSKSQVAAYWASLMGIDTANAERYVAALLAKNVTNELKVADVLVEGHGYERPALYKLADLLVPANRVNLRDRRCQIPIKMIFQPTMMCVTKCVYCYSDTAFGRQKTPLTLRRIEELLREARSLDIFYVSFSGGDPFARSDMFEILEVMKSLAMRAQVPTKYPLSKAQVAKLERLGDTLDLQISIDAIEPRILDSIVGVAGYHKKIKRTLRELAEAGIPLRTNSVLMPCNVEDAENLVKYLASLGNVRRISMTPYARSFFRHDDSMFLGRAAAMELTRNLPGLREKGQKITINFSAGGTDDADRSLDLESKARSFSQRAVCTAGLWGFILLPDGHVTGCEEFGWRPRFLLGDVREKSIMDMWRAAGAHSMLSPQRAQFAGSACESCATFDACMNGPGRCIRDVMKAYGLENDHYPDPRCPAAPPASRIS